MNHFTANMLLLHQSNELTSTNKRLIAQQLLTNAQLASDFESLKTIQNEILNIQAPQNPGFTARLLNRISTENTELV
jgi:peroxiredoxin